MRIKMITSLTYDRNVKELNALMQIIKDLAAKSTDEYWKMGQASSGEEILQYFGENELLDMLFYDISCDEAIPSLQKIRSGYKNTALLLIADAHISPMVYLRPDIMASSLLLRPWDYQTAWDTIREFIKSYLQNVKSQSGMKMYAIETREGTINIPYEKIYFFEAREKKVYVCVGKEEYGFYTTLDTLMGKLPEQFIRCHRGFIVNTDKIRKIMISKNIIYLEEGFDVPLSRSYKEVVKKLGK